MANCLQARPIGCAYFSIYSSHDFAAFATIGSFVAFGPGTRSFNVSLPFGSTGGGSEIFGRVAFGVGAIIAWLCLILVAVGGWRKFVSRNNT